MKPTVRIGCYSAFWGDSATPAAAQLLTHGRLDYVVADYLAEVTMGVLAKRAQRGQPAYVDEFVTRVLAPLWDRVPSVRIVTNAGGLDPTGLARAIRKLAADRGASDLVVAAVDCAAPCDPRQLHPFSPTNDDAHEDAATPDAEWVSVSPYIGAFPIAEALRRGAHIVVTGRVVDSALVLGPMIHEFGWTPTDYDALAAGSLVGHLLECGCHATGGNFTDWQLVYRGWPNMGYPIAEVHRDGSAVLTKPPNTGGLVSRLSVGEQLVYEVLDPRAYLLPDVTLNLAHVTLDEIGENRVAVRGARGHPPPASLKVSGILQGDYSLTAELVVPGVDAPRKARALGAAIVRRANGIAQRMLGLDKPIDQYRIDVLGSEEPLFGQARTEAREVILRIAAAHPDRRALGVLALELAPAATCMAPGLCSSGAGRPKISRQLRHVSALVPKQHVAARVHIGDGTVVDVPFVQTAIWTPQLDTPGPSTQDLPHEVSVPLHWVAVARSGDKGDASNVGVLVRHPDLYGVLLHQLTPEVVQRALAHFMTPRSRVVRYTLPGVHAVNFVLTHALGGGGLASLRVDRQGKTYAQVLLAAATVCVPAAWAQRLEHDAQGRDALVIGAAKL